MDGSGYVHILISESIHIKLNRDEPVDNELLYHGLSIIVEDGVE